MKKIFAAIKKFSELEIVCLGAIVAALVFDMYYLDIKNPLQYSLSEIGRFNHALFIVWSVLSGLGLLLNVPRFYKRIGYESKLGKGALYAGLIFLVLTFCNMKKDPEILYWIHVATAILFAVLAFASIALGLLYMFKKNKRYRILTIIFFALCLVDIIFLCIYKQMALFEFIPLILGYIVLIFTNFTDTFKLVSPSAES